MPARVVRGSASEPNPGAKVVYRIANSQTRTASAPNDVWRIDFKGWFRTRDGQRCDPLTVSDAYSRFLLACVIVPPLTKKIRPVVEQLFRRYGLPLAIRSDNGSLFATTGVGGLSRLSVGWVKAGIALERIVGETWTEQQPDRFGVHRYRPGTARL